MSPGGMGDWVHIWCYFFGQKSSALSLLVTGAQFWDGQSTASVGERTQIVDETIACLFVSIVVSRSLGFNQLTSVAVGVFDKMTALSSL